MKKDCQIAFNSHSVFIFFIALIFVLIFLSCLMTNEIVGAIFFCLISLCGLFYISVSPIYVLFSETEITIKYFWKQKEQIPWDLIKYIEVGGNWISKGPLPYYRIIYPHVPNKFFFVNNEIPRTRRTQKLLHLYWKEKIRGEKRARKK